MRSGSTVILNQNVAARRINPSPAAKSAAHDNPFEPGTRLDRYLLLERLGGGGTGTVYRARDTELDREVALKVLGRPYCHQAETLNRFRAEAQAQARLRSPHVVTLYSILEYAFAALLVLEYVEGETLEGRLRSGGPLSADEAVMIFEQALVGLAHVHEMGIIHRDLKPSNLFVTTAGLVKVMDFSVAKLATRDTFPPQTMVGTLLYIAPEQISGRAIDERSDIYALGMSLYEAVTGRLPFALDSDYELMHAHVQEQPPRPRDIVPSLPAGFERVILKAIEKEPARRYRSAIEFRTALLKLGAPASPHTISLPANAYGPVPRRESAQSERRVLAGFALDLMLVVAICGMLYALGLYPAKTVTVESPLATAPVPARSTVARPTRVGNTPSAHRSTDPSDPYSALRKAWGE